jgi:hypothetical protein
LLGKIILEKNGLDRADLCTYTTVNTFIWIDEILIGVIRRVDAIDRTDLDATIVLHADARLGNDIRHDTTLPTRESRAAKTGALGTRS